MALDNYAWPSVMEVIQMSAESPALTLAPNGVLGTGPQQNWATTPRQ